MVVLPDADMELAADSAVNAAYGSAGERCMSISVLVTVGDAADRLLPLAATAARRDRGGQRCGCRERHGSARVAGTPRSACSATWRPACAKGAVLLADGREVQVDGAEGGFFLGPCLFDRVRPEMSIYRDEIFGPVLSVVRTAGFDEALALVNANRFANGVAVFTNDGGAARRFQREVQVGMVGINVPIPVPMAYHSFGGWKDSLFGDAHVHGAEGVRFYTRAKVVTARWPEPQLRGKDLGFPQHR